MSGYFVRLAAQMNRPGAAARDGDAPEPAALESHVELEAPSAAPLKQATQTVASAHRQRPPATIAKQTAPLPKPPSPEPSAGGALDAGQAVAMRDPPLRAAELMSSAPADTIESTDMAFAPNSGSAMPVGPLAHRMAPAATVDGAVNPPPPANAATRLAVRVTEAPPGRVPGNAEQRAWPAQPSYWFTAPTARINEVNGVQQNPARPPAGPANQVAAAPRNDVRIGTITLEVRPPASPAAAPHQPVAAATPAPRQFALRRHYLRWS